MGYSKLSVNEQYRAVEELNQIGRADLHPRIAQALPEWTPTVTLPEASLRKSASVKSCAVATTSGKQIESEDGEMNCM